MSFEKITKYTSEPIESVCGMDEAGRGPWAGPVLASAVICTKEIRFHGLNDSKLLSEQQREKLYKKITATCCYGVGMASNKEIDKLGLTKAVNLAFQRALAQLQTKHPELSPKILLIDGRDKFKFSFPYISIIKGDQKIKLISCASIIAKVERDRIMKDNHKKYPDYHFHQHKGYGTAKHRAAIAARGPCPIHRLSYQPLLPYTQNTAK